MKQEKSKICYRVLKTKQHLVNKTKNSALFVIIGIVCFLALFAKQFFYIFFISPICITLHNHDFKK